MPEPGNRRVIEPGEIECAIVIQELVPRRTGASLPVQQPEPGRGLRRAVVDQHDQHVQRMLLPLDRLQALDRRLDLILERNDYE